MNELMLHIPQMIGITGQSGSGKSTLATQLTHLCNEVGRPVIHLSTGELGRQRAQSGTHIGRKIGALNAAGKRFSQLVGMGMIFRELEDRFTGNEIIIIEGAPRGKDEYHILKGLFDDGIVSSFAVIESVASGIICRQRVIKRTEEDHRLDLCIPGTHTPDLVTIDNKLRWWTEDRSDILKPIIDDGAYISIQNEGSIDAIRNQLIAHFA